jgi:hypothetical protein
MQHNMTFEKMQRPIRQAQQSQGTQSRSQRNAQAETQRGKQWKRENLRAQFLH